ncbi:MAG: tRNA (N6-threonylcarbamoyladenosine(37)-N6)-methyltransferase TrmO [Catonella sp.]|uniref:tRNA (N6-threonylcarbamoyladenosine(37)-N6)-methyltransferase TrmO n=1 Tax=Catonella sp. TaxID=2382125 RepID=UPI003F9F17AF
MKIIGRIHTDFKEKFGIPRQSGLVEELTAKIYFEPEYRNIDAFRGLEGFNYIWLIWKFSETVTDTFRASVRPPRLPRNEHLGVFATRAPYRPNPIGLSSVKLLSIENTEEGPVLTVGGADLLDGTPIYDIKPYLPYADCHMDALAGYTEITKKHILEVEIPEEELTKVIGEKRETLIKVLKQDPRPSYQQEDEDRIYGMFFANYEIKFRVINNILKVINIDDVID